MEFARDFAKQWLPAWNSGDLERIFSLYMDGFEMRSPLIAERGFSATGVLRGKNAIRPYWAGRIVGNTEARPYCLSQMMSAEWLAASARYNRWMNDKLYGLAATLSDEVRKRDAGAFFKSIHGTFNHLLLADKVWLARFKGVSVPDGFMGPGGIRSLEQELHGDFEDLRRERALTDDELSAWVSTLTDEQLAGPLLFMRRGQKHECPLWWAVAHVFNHQTHHRGQITALLTQQGCDPGVTDLFAMLREETARASVR